MNEALKQNMKMVFLGDPGSGKTTLLKFIVLCYARKQTNRLGLDEKRLPIYVRLADFASHWLEQRHNYSLVDFFYTQAYENFHVKLKPDFFKSEL